MTYFSAAQVFPPHDWIGTILGEIRANAERWTQAADCSALPGRSSANY